MPDPGGDRACECDGEWGWDEEGDGRLRMRSAGLKAADGGANAPGLVLEGEMMSSGMGALALLEEGGVHVNVCVRRACVPFAICLTL